jgi:hypothetical protein
MLLACLHCCGVVCIYGNGYTSSVCVCVCLCVCVCSVCVCGGRIAVDKV